MPFRSPKFNDSPTFVAVLSKHYAEVVATPAEPPAGDESVFAAAAAEAAAPAEATGVGADVPFVVESLVTAEAIDG